MTERELINNYVMKCWDAGSPDEIKKYLLELLDNSQPNGGDRVVSENEKQEKDYSCPKCFKEFDDHYLQVLHKSFCDFEE